MTLDASFANQKLIVKKLNTTNPELIKKMNNIGLYENQIVKILNKKSNKHIVHIQIYNIEYAFRISDLKFIDFDYVK